jgi:hypothetical protein
MPLTAEQTTIIRSSLDPSGFKRGMADMTNAAKQGGAQIESANDRVTASTTKTTRAVVDGGAAYERYKRQVDPAYAAAQKFAQIQATANRALEAGRASQVDVNRTIELAAAKYGTASRAAGDLATANSRAGFAARDLGLQSIDMFQQLASGAPVMRTLIQQGGQVVQVNAAMGVGFKETAQAIRGATAAAAAFIATPIGLAIAAVVALSAAVYEVGSRAEQLAEQQKDFTIALQATGRTADVSTAALGKYVEQLRSVGESAAEAQKQVTALARNRGLSQGQIGQIVSLAPDLGTATGTDTATAIKTLTQVELGNVDAIRKLNDALGFLTPTQENAAQAAKDHNDALKAAQIAIENLAPKIRGLEEQSLTPAGEAVRNLTNAWDGFVDSVAKSDFVTRILQGIANTLNDIGGASNAIDLAKLTGQLADMQGAAAKVKTDLAQIPAILHGTEVTAPLDKQLAADQAAIDRIQKQIDAITSKAHNLSAAAGYSTSPSNSKLDQASVNAERLANQIVGSSKAGQITTLTTQIHQLQTAMDKLDPSAAKNVALIIKYKNAIADNQQKIADLTKTTEKHTAATEKHRSTLVKLADTTTAQIEEQHKLAAAYGEGYDAVLKVQAVYEAQQKVISSGLIPGTKKFTAAVEQQTAANLELAQAKGQADLAKQIADTKTATESQLAINAAYDGTAQSIQHASNYQKSYNTALQHGYQKDTPAFIKVVNESTDALDRRNAATQALVQQQASVSALAGAFNQAFNTIGDAITQAFVQGQGAAVDFGNVAKAVLSQLVQQFIQLAALNPLENALFGGTRGTLGGALGALGAGSSVSGGGGGDILGNVGSIGRLLGAGSGSISPSIDAFGAAHLPGLFGASATTPTLLTSDLGGITAGTAGVQGGGGLLSGLGGFSSLSNILGIGGAAIPGLISGNFAQAGLGLGGAALGTALFPGIGTIIGGLAGNLLGGLFHGPPKNEFSTTQVDVGQNGLLRLGTTDSQLAQNSEAIKAAQKTIDDLNSLLSGNNIRIGNPRSAPTNQFDDRGLIGRFGYDKGDNSTLGNAGADFSSLFPLLRFDFSRSAHPEIQSVFNNRGYINAPFSGFSNSAQLGNTITALSKLSDDLHNNAPSAWQKFFDVLINTPTDQLAAEAQKLDTFLTQTVPTLEAFGKVTGSLNDQISQINATFAPAIQMAQQLGYAEADLAKARDDAIAKAKEQANFTMDQTIRGITGRYLTATATTPAAQQAAALFNFDTQAAAQKRQLDQQITSIWGDAARQTAAYNQQMATLDKTLAAERLAIAQQFTDQATALAKQAAKQFADAQASIHKYDQSLNVRYATAAAQVSGAANDNQSAALYAFDIQAQQERDAFVQTLVDTYGASVKATQGYAAQLALEDKTLAEERLAIQKQYADQAKQLQEQQQQQAQQSVVSVLQGIDQYAKSIQQGSLSALSAQDQYLLAQRQFNAVSGAAQAGDFASAQQLTGYANAFLTASRNENGSGLQYATDYQAVVAALNSVAAQTPDQLTQSAMNAALRTGFTNVVDVLNGVRSDIQALGRKAELNGVLTGRAA